MRCRWAASLLAAVAVLAVDPAVALATRASRDSTHVIVEGGLGQHNTIEVSQIGTATFVIKETAFGPDVNAGSGCTQVSDKEARCPATNISRVTVDLKDDNDELATSSLQVPLTVDGGTGDDILRASDRPDSVNGGLGNDTVVALGGADTVDGGAGADSISGGSQDDTLKGGPGPDTIDGGSEKDSLSGGLEDDVISGGAGDDKFTGDAGNDKLSGDDGDDSYEESPVESGADDYRGGSGVDKVVYSVRALLRRVLVTLDDGPNDGFGTEHDNIHSDVESVFATINDDFLQGNAADNTIGAAAGNDDLNGGAGVDKLDGGQNDDIIVAREDVVPAFADTVECGTGTDFAAVDLQDIVKPGCETIEGARVGQGPNVRIRRSRVRVDRRGRVRIPLRCPRAQPAGCRGTVTLTRRRGGKRLGRARFALSPGARRTVRLRLPRADRRRLRRGRLPARVRALERDPLGFPKTTTVVFTLRR